MNRTLSNESPRVEEQSNLEVRVEARSDTARAADTLAKPLSFGAAFADLMFVAHHSNQRWHDAAIVPYAPIPLSPSAKVLHYGLEVFEGHKAYRWENGDVALFRPDCNAERLNASATRMRLPTVPVELQRQATLRLVDLLRDWVPSVPGSSLYIRPMIIGTEPALGVVPAGSHMYLLLAALAGPYFPKGFAAISVVVETVQPRAVPGGIGEAKTGANYAAGMDAKARAKNAGFDEVLFLDAIEHRYLEELSGMNVFVVENGKRLLTPPLDGTILRGITRRSIIELASDLNLEAEERPIAIDDLTRGIEDGTITEMMAVGTAAVVTPIGYLTLNGRRHTIGDGAPGAVARGVYDAITGIQYGRLPDTRGWMRVVRS